MLREVGGSPHQGPLGSRNKNTALKNLAERTSTLRPNVPMNKTSRKQFKLSKWEEKSSKSSQLFKTTHASN